MYIAFLWHMHQPFYKDLFHDEYSMPWTFLHAIKDYNDMIEIVNEMNDVKVSFNFVPSLIEQIRDYSNSLEKDYFLRLISKNVNTLSDEQKKEILRQIFCINYQNMVVPLKRFRKLYDKKDFKIYTNEEILDLEVLYLLAWTGHYLREESDIIQNLLLKGEKFTEEDKETLLNTYQLFLKTLLNKYKTAFLNNKIELTTSPYYHPILPLLINFESAKIAMPDVNLPKMNNLFYDDAEQHISRAKSLFENVFDLSCKGMWPSEGSVSPEVLEIVKKYNFLWLATDEGILFNSKNISHRKKLYYPYDYNGIKVFFRDKDLSNLIGFIYSKWNYKDAARDFYNRIKEIEKLTDDSNAIVSIILDGENAWEFYENNGIPFLKEMYELIAKDTTLKFTTFSEYLSKKDSKVEELSYIHSGSWINSNFQIWIGHPEENEAWELVDKAKTILKNHDNKNSQNYNLAYEELLIAQGSDWFWWYGDDFYSEFSDKFDILFRTHIANVYSFLNEDIPANVLKPIKKGEKERNIITAPTDVINPTIDGKVTDYFEWLSAGVCNFERIDSTMHFDGYYITKLFYGFNEEYLFLRMDGIKEIGDIFSDCILELNIHNKDFLKIEYYFSNNAIKIVKNKTTIENHNIKIACKDIIEIAIPFNEVNFTSGEELSLIIEISKNGNLLYRLPYDSFINIKIPENLKLEYWMV